LRRACRQEEDSSVALPRLRPLPGFLLAVTVIAELAAVLLSWGLEPLWDTLLYAVACVVTVAAGALILSRHPRHVVGWLLLLPALQSAVSSDLAQGWGKRAADQGWPLGQHAEFLVTGSWVILTPLTIALLLVFPTGRLLHPRWSLVVWLSVVATLATEVGWVFNADAGSEYVAGRNPYVVEWLPTEVLFVGGFSLVALSFLAALVAVVIRFRRSRGVERLQMKWFALGSAILAIGLPLGGALWFVSPVAHVIPALVITVWPITICVAILRYRLYDVDLVISRAFAYGVLTALLAAVYAVAVVVLGAFAGRDSAWVAAGATLLAAVAFRFLHARVQVLVDRRFRPARHKALDLVATFVEDLRNDRAEPERVVEVLGRAVGDPDLQLWFVLDPDEPPVDERGRPVHESVDDVTERYPVTRAGTLLGEVVWRPPTDEAGVLLPEVVDAAGVAIEMARLRVELRRRLDEVDESRARIAAVADEERRRIERDLHDGAQQRLVSIGLALRHAQHQLGADPDEARRTLDGAVVEIGSAIGELRGLAHGIRPALLQAGLGPALRELADRAPVPVRVSADADRYAPDLEAAAYFVACEGLTNAVKHARAEEIVLEVARRNSTLVVTIADDGVGGARVGTGSGLTGLSDRVAARGGRLQVVSDRGRGTTLRAELPCVS
jgi:signal transduction histidine kinase